jgi:hypothetical protein
MWKLESGLDFLNVADMWRGSGGEAGLRLHESSTVG